MRANNNESFVPVTVDELMYQFCTNEKRKEIKTVRDNHKDELMKKSLNGKSDDDVKQHVEEVFRAWTEMMKDPDNDFARFKNE